MSLIYPEEAFRRFGPAPIAVHDANGRRLRFVVACDPVTGEVIDHDVSQPNEIYYRLANWSPWYWPLYRMLSKRWDIKVGSYATRHYFAPAPLTIAPVKS